MSKRKKKKRPAKQAHLSGTQPTGVSQGLALQGWLIAGLAALLTATPLIPSEGFAAFGAISVLIMLWVLLLAAWTLDGLFKGSLEVRLCWTSGTIVVLILLHSFSAAVMSSQGSPRAAINMLWVWVAVGVCFFLIRQLIRRPTECRALISVMIALAIFQSAYGFYQYAVENPETRRQYEADPDRQLQINGIVAPAGSPQRKHFEDRLYSTEPMGAFGLTNSLAGFLTPWLIMLLGIGLVSSSGNVFSDRSNRFKLAVVLAGVLLLGGCILLTKSRTAYLATAFGAGLVFVMITKDRLRFGWKKPLSMTAVVFVLLLAAIYSGGLSMLGLDREVLSEAPKSLLYRLEYWRGAASMIADHPLLGSGPGNFQQNYTLYKLPQASETISDPHNLFLEVWATAGSLTLLAFVAVMGCFVWRLRNGAVLKSNSPFQKSESSDENPGAAITTKSRKTSNDHSQDYTKQIYYGAFFGVLLALPVGMLAGFGYSLDLLWIGLPLAIGAVAVLHPWVLSGKLPTKLVVIALATLGINLLAAGGIGFLGVALSGWTLMAVALNLGDQGTSLIKLSKLHSLLLLLASFGLGAVCHQTEFSSVLIAKGHLLRGQELRTLGQSDKTEDAFLEAAKADPFWDEPWQHLAALYHYRWLESKEPEDFDRFLSAAEKMISLNPKSHSSHSLYGHWFLASYGQNRDSDFLDQATMSYQKAVALYPHSNLTRAQLAWAHHIAGNSDAASREAEEALRLDALTPHAELKLWIQKLFSPTPSANSTDPLPRIEEGESAEHLMKKLRNIGK